MSLLHSLVCMASPEIGQFDNAVFGNHDIVGLHIAVNQTALLPRVTERLGDLLNDMERLINRNPAFSEESSSGRFPR